MRKLLKRIRKILVGFILRYTIAEGFAILSLFGSFIVAFWYGSQCVYQNPMCPASLSFHTYTAGSVIRIFYAMCFPAISLNQITPCTHKVVQGKKAAARIFSIIDRVPLIKSKPDAIIPPEFIGII